MDWDFGDVLLSMAVFFFWILFISMFISAFMDVFRRRDLSGWGKAGWTLFMVIFPFLGILIYMITRPKPTPEELAEMNYAYGGVRTVSSADEIAKLADLKDRGAISEDEFRALKSKALA